MADLLAYTSSATSWSSRNLLALYLFPAAPAALVQPLSAIHNVKPLQPLQLACSSLGVQLSLHSGPCCHHAAFAAIMGPLPPSRGPCRHHAAPSTLMQPLLPSCGPCSHHAAIAAVSGPCRHHATPCRHHAAPAAIMQPLPPLCGPCYHHAAPCRNHVALAPIRPLWLDCWSATSSAASAPAPLLSPPQPSLEGPCSGPEFTTVGSG